MTRASLRIAVLLFAAVVLAPADATAERQEHIGWIDAIDCQALFRAADDAKVEQLDGKRDHFRFLYPGESVQCAAGKSMLVRIDRDVIRITAAKCWFPIRRVPASESSPPCAVFQERGPADRAFAPSEAVREFMKGGRTVGRTRPMRSSIFSPADGSAIVPARLVIRWTPTKAATSLRLRVVDKYSGVIWQQDAVDGAAVALASDEARRALTAWRDAGNTGALRLILTSRADEPPVEFSVLSAADERALSVELTACESEKGLMQFVCRTHVLDRHRLWNDAATEYDAALALEPGSRDLLLAAIAAHKRIGNALHASELIGRLPPGVNVPD